MEQLSGLIPVLLTPMQDRDQIDAPGVERLVNHLCEKNIGGLWVLGTGGEDMSLSYHQRLKVVESVVKAVNQRVPIVVGCSFFSMTESISFLHDTKDFPIDYYHAMPYHPLLSLDRIEYWYQELANEASKGLWMYTSANWARHIPPEFVQKLKYYDNIVGVKYSTSNSVHMGAVAALADSNFQVLSAVIKTLVPSLALGIKAATTVEACVYSGPIIKIFEAFRKGDLEEALRLQRNFNAFIDLLPKQHATDNFLRVAELKYLLSRDGICSDKMAGYYRSLNDDEKLQVMAIIEEYSQMLTET